MIRRRRRRQARRRIVLAALIALAVIVVAVVLIYKPDIALDRITIEAGGVLPNASVFSKKPDVALEYEEGTIDRVDPGTPGDYPVVVRKGRHRYNVILQVVDTQAPTIVGARDIVVPIGDGVSYQQDVHVSDNASAKPELEVDTSAVSLSKVGEYPVIYTARDASGNSSSVTVTLTIRDKTPEEKSRDQLFALADGALAACVTDSMSDYERLWAIFGYISGHITYVDNAESDDEVAEGINGFVKRSGSCFTYFASMKAMLERAGFETVDVVRDNTKKEGHHYWSLVKYQGQWYHIDATPRGPEDGREHLVFLLTDSQILEMNANYGNYWAYDTKEYPASGTVSPYRGEPLS